MIRTGKRPCFFKLLGTWTALVVACAAATAARAQDPQALDEIDNPHVWKPRVTSVTVFKNGLGFFMCEGEVELRDGWCIAPQVPAAAFGTLVIFSHDANTVVDIVGSGPGEVVDFDGKDAMADTAAKRARLEASKNLRVELTYKYKDASRTAAGKLVSVGPEFVVLDAEGTHFAVGLEGLKRLQVLDLPLRIHVEGVKKGSRVKIGMAYLRKGVTWIPEYTVKVLDDASADLTLRGTLINEAQDMIHCDVNFVVGVPHFVHTDYVAPVAVGQVIRTIGTAVAPRELRTQIASRAAIVANTAASQFERVPTIEQEVRPGEDKLGSLMGSLPQLEGPGATDYTVYTKKDLTLRGGEKAIVTLLVTKVKYDHIYRWDSPAKMKHFLRLANTSETAWTTGACLALSGGRPLSEDLLKYTPRGGYCEIPMTEAVNIAHDHVEREIDRKLKAYSPASNVHWDLVVIEGEMKLRNFENRSVHIVVTANLPGKPLSASDEGKTEADPTKLKLLEREGTVRWIVQLEAGEQKTLKFTYERYVPSM